MGSYETVYLAEKHSIALALADVLPGRRVKRDGYIECGSAAVTWLSGHLLEQAPPEAYGAQYKYWRRETLPIVPQEFISTVRKDRQIPRQMAVIKALLASAPSAVNAADFDREGQLLVDEVLELVHYKGSVLRLQTKALDKTSLLRELGRMRPNSEFAGLRDAARARSELDWLAGMNLTRAMTIHWRSGATGVLSLGRVQTPTLALIVDRDLAIENFVSKPYWTLECPFTAEAGPFTAQFVPQPDMEGIDEEKRLVDKAIADRIAKEASSQPGTVAAVERRQVSEAAPLPYTLTDIQKEASAKYGMGASTVLAACQSLYEAKYASYPRTDCNFLPLEQFAEAPQVLAAAGAWPGMEEMAKLADPARKSACWNTSKVKAHHAIIPTAVPAKNLSERDAKIYALICRRYIWQFLPPHRFEKTRIDVDCAGWQWRAQGRVDIEAGWAAFKDRDPKDKEKVLPPVAKGDPVQSGEVKEAEHKTEPPKRFTEGTLVDAMENIQRFLKDASRDEKSILTKTEGLGTVATRASIIQTLFNRQYIERQGKAIVSTPLGRELVRLCPKSIKDPLMTADMERSLSEIQDGRIPFKEYVAGYAAKLPALLDELFAVAPAEGRGFAAAAPSASSASSQASGPSSSGRRQGRRSQAGKAEAAPAAPNASSDASGPRCPRCGSELKLRQGKNGPFWGCSGYPRCRFTCPDANGAPAMGSVQAVPAGTASDPVPDYGSGSMPDYPARFSQPGNAMPMQAPNNSEDGKDGAGTICPRCQEGHLAPHEGKDGPAWRCDRYPRCRYACPDRNGAPDLAAAPTKPSRRKKATTAAMATSAASTGRQPALAAGGATGDFGHSSGFGHAGAQNSSDAA
ncbi:MAG: DNA topoisomerase 3, partial [Desulfovibrio sp.]|nr:DNA topoisomerase 3 [Desulfovibrio sp.]